MRTHLEIEAKYELDDGQPLPDLVGIAGVVSMAVHAEMELTATYFDTETHSLGAAGATLRRRTGGEDDGWHLKLPLADRERLEVRRDLGRSQTPPAALTALVRALVRSESLAPVATLVNHRVVRHLVDAEGRVLAEMADDRVSGQRHDDVDSDVGTVTWRELEVELVEGDRVLLEELDAAVRAAGIAAAGASSKVARVLGAGAAGSSVPAQPPRRRRRTPVAEVLLAGLQFAVTNLLGIDPLLRLDRPGAPQRMRSAVVRLRAAVALYGQVVPDERTSHVRAELAWLESVVADVDELDAASVRIREALAAEPKELVLGPVGRRVDRDLAAARRTAVSLLRESMDSPRYLDLLDAAASLAASVPAGSGDRAGDVLPDLADRAVRRAERRIVELGRSGTEEERGWRRRSAVRAVERARYAEALATGAAGQGAMAQLLDEMARLLAEQEACARAQDLLRTIAVKAHPAGENGFTFGRLHGLEQVHAAALQRRVDKLRKHVKRLRTV